MFKLWIINQSLLGDHCDQDTKNLIDSCQDPKLLQKILWWGLNPEHFHYGNGMVIQHKEIIFSQKKEE